MRLDAPDRLDELRQRVARHATAPGKVEAALPGVRFHRADRPAAFGPGRATSLMLAVIVQGQKVIHVGDQQLRYDAETYLVLTGECDFRSAVVEASPARPYLSMTVKLPPEEVVRTILSMGDERGPAGAPEASPAYAARIDAPLAETLCRLLRTLDDPAERRMVAPLVMSELVFRLLRSDAAAMIRHAAGKDGDQARIDQAMAFMRANLARRLSVAAVARHVAMSPSHFAHRFREVARTSPMSYLKHARLQAARLALLHEGASPAQAAAQVGYQSAAHFSRDFKGCFELPPASYARRFRAGGAGSQDPASSPQPAPSP